MHADFLESAPEDPIDLFEQWYAEARAHETSLVHAMTLATADADGRPSARMVLLKGFDRQGFVFYTNYESRKAAELQINPRAALCFWWPVLKRQVRITGDVQKVGDETSDDYYQSRPIGSRLGAWASPQSQEIAGRATLTDKYEDVKRRFGDDPPRPPFWGGYRVSHREVEFWWDRDDRLHDRLAYRLTATGDWRRGRLAP